MAPQGHPVSCDLVVSGRLYWSTWARRGDRVEGRLEYASYERDGVTISTADVRVSEVVSLNAKAGVSEAEMEEAA